VSDPLFRLPARPSLEQLRKQAKELSRSDGIPLAEAQFRLARQYGFADWPTLVHYVQAANPLGLMAYEDLAKALVAAYTSGDFTAIREINWERGTGFVWDRDLTQMQQRLPTWFASESRDADLATADARQLVARQLGFEHWEGLKQSLAPPSPKSAPSEPPFYRINRETNTIEVRGPLAPRHWDTVVSVVKEQGITGLGAGGITDDALERVARLDELTRLVIGSGLLTDDGLLHLARLPQLEELEVGGPKSPITDRGLVVLRQLRALKRFQTCWSQHITDAGVANLSFCDQLEKVDLMGTPTGDGAVNALRGKRTLRSFKTGRLVTDRGIPLLHDFPVFKSWQGGEVKYGLMGFEGEPNNLLIDGPFTDDGLRALAGLDGLFSLGFFWHSHAFTSGGLASLAALPRLGFLGCQGDRCDDAAMRQIAAIPTLRMLMAQGTVAGDDGFAALARSPTLEHIWGRECPNLKSRGFAALAAMPALKGLAVSCLQVDDAALATLPRFPALRFLMPMDVQDDGFGHVGRCERLESLWCMYCRETGDVATDHIAGLKLKYYYAGKTRITDRSLETLSGMASLEELELWETARITNAGLAALARLPRLRKLSVDAPNVTRDAFTVFPASVRVNY